MCRRIILSIVACFFLAMAYSQESCQDVDSLANQQYLQKDWEGLIKLGRRVKKKDFNSSYLQYRIGVAFYIKKNYMKSIPYFQKVLDSNNLVASAYSYLYYAYIFSGQEEKAEMLKATLPPEVRVTFSQETAPFVKNVGVLALYSDFTTEDYMNRDLTGGNNIYGELSPILLQDSGVVVSSTQRLGPSIRLAESFTFLGMKYFQAYTFNNENRVYVQNYDQLQGYINASKQFKNNWKFVFGGHYMSYQFNNLEHRGVTDTISVTESYRSYDTLIFGDTNHVEISQTYPMAEYSVLSDTLSKRYNDFVFYAGFKNSCSYFQNKFGVAYSRLWGADYLSLHTNHTYYPLGNTNLFLSLQLIAKHNLSTDTEDLQYLFGGKIGFMTFKNLYTTLEYKYADINNYVDMDGAAVFNHSYNLTQSFGLNLIWMFLKERLIVNTSFEYNFYKHFYSYFEIDEAEEIEKTISYYSETVDSFNNVYQQTTNYTYQMPYNTHITKQKDFTFNNYNIKLGLSWYF